MNREIKFRAWDKEQGMMLEDICTNTDDFTDMLNDTFRYWQDEKIGHLILMQFTGLKDKNGKEIYEGDIVKWHGYTGIVKYLPSCGQHSGPGFYITFLDPDEVVSFHRVNNKNPASTDWDVIGNQFENTELLKQV